MLLPVLAGLAAGAGHALTGPDHVAAILPLAADRPDRGARLGLTWGAGHGLGTVALAALALSLRAGFDVDAISAHAEQIVGVALVLTGAWGVHRARQPAEGGARHGLALGMGTLHGLAGGSHALVVLSALALPAGSAAAWLAAFVGGAAGAMVGLAWALQLAGHRARDLTAPRLLAGLVAIAVGVAWIFAA